MDRCLGWEYGYASTVDDDDIYGCDWSKCSKCKTWAHSGCIKSNIALNCGRYSQSSYISAEIERNLVMLQSILLLICTLYFVQNRLNEHAYFCWRLSHSNKILHYQSLLTFLIFQGISSKTLPISICMI